MSENNESSFNLKITVNDILLIVLIGVTFMTYSVAKSALELEQEKYSPSIITTEYFPVQEISDTVETAFLFENEGEKRGGYTFYAVSNEFWIEREDDNKGKRREVKLSYGIGKGEPARLKFKIHMPLEKQLPSFASYRLTLTTSTQGVIHDRNYCYQLVENKKYVNVGCPTINN